MGDRWFRMYAAQRSPSNREVFTSSWDIRRKTFRLQLRKISLLKVAALDLFINATSEALATQ